MCRHSQAELRAFFELPPPPVAHRAAADVAVLAQIVKALANLAGVGMQGLMALECKRKFKGFFQLYEGWVFIICKCTQLCELKLCIGCCLACMRELVRLKLLHSYLQPPQSMYTVSQPTSQVLIHLLNSRCCEDSCCSEGLHS